MFHIQTELEYISLCIDTGTSLQYFLSLVVFGVFLSSLLDPANSSCLQHFNVSLSLVFRPTFLTPLLSKGSKTHCSRLVLAPHQSNLLSFFSENVVPVFSMTDVCTPIHSVNCIKVSHCTTKKTIRLTFSKIPLCAPLVCCPLFPPAQLQRFVLLLNKSPLEL